MQFQSTQQAMNQFSNTQRYVTTAAYVELQRSSVSKLPAILIPHLAEGNCGLSAVAVVCVHTVECAVGVGRIDYSAGETGLSYFIIAVTNRNV